MVSVSWGRGVGHLLLALRHLGDHLNLFGAAPLAEFVHGFEHGPADGQGQGAFQHVGDVDVHSGSGIIIWDGVFFLVYREPEIVVIEDHIAILGLDDDTRGCPVTHCRTRKHHAGLGDK